MCSSDLFPSHDSYDGDEALSLIYENNFDLLLLDVNVPNKNGFEVLKEVRNQKKTVPAIFITSLNCIIVV